MRSLCADNSQCLFGFPKNLLTHITHQEGEGKNHMKQNAGCEASWSLEAQEKWPHFPERGEASGAGGAFLDEWFEDPQGP